MRSITTLYKEMTPSQLAIVSVNASLNGDDETPKAILGYVPKRTYSCTDAGYTDLAQFVTAWLLAIGSDYWKARAKHIGSLFYLTRIAAKTGSLEDLERADKVLDATQDWDTCAKVISYACSLACREIGLDEEAARKYLELPEAEVLDRDSLSPEYCEMLESIMSNWREAVARVSQ